MPGPPSENRRSHTRWRLEKDLFCYVDGRRLDARCENISEGGLFVQTGDHMALPLGATVGLVFRQETGYGHPVFLFGRVRRRQAGEQPGVGLQWDKAVTDGASDQLRDFLERMFKIPAPDIREGSGGPPGAERCVFRFPLQSTNPVLTLKYQKPNPDEAPVNRLDRAAPLPVSRVPGGSLDVPPHVFTGEELNHSKKPGAISQAVARKRSLSPVSLDAELVSDNAQGKGKVIRMGLEALVIQARDFHADTSSYVSTRVSIPSETGYFPIVCKCLVESSADGTGHGEKVLELKVTDVDECGKPGVLSRYVKWLHFHSLART